MTQHKTIDRRKVATDAQSVARRLAEQKRAQQTAPAARTAATPATGGYHSPREYGGQRGFYEARVNETRTAMEQQQAAFREAQKALEASRRQADEQQKRYESLKDKFRGETAEQYRKQLMDQWTSAVQEYKTAQGAYDNAWTAYQPYEDAYNAAIGEYNTYMAGERAAYDGWKASIRGADEIREEQKGIKEKRTELQRRMQMANDIAAGTAAPGIMAQAAQNEAAIRELQEYLGGAGDREKLLQEELDWSEHFRFEDLRQNADFGEMSRFTGVDNQGDRVYQYVNGNPNAVSGSIDALLDSGTQDDLLLQMMGGNDGWRDIIGYNETPTYLEHMTEDEKAMYNYVYSTQGRDAAQGYLDYLKPELTARKTGTATKFWRMLAGQNALTGALYSGLSVPMNAAGGIQAGLGQVASALRGEELDPNASYNLMANTKNAIRDEVSGKIQEHAGPVGSFAYGTVMSMADMAMDAAAGNPAAATALIGTRAFSEQVIDSKKRGLSDEQALSMGITSAFAELVTEKLGLDELLHLPDKWATAGFWKGAARGAGGEALEEGLTNLMNLAADISIAGDKSEFAQSVERYKAEGLSEEKAVWKALGDAGWSLAADMAGGAISGGVYGGWNGWQGKKAEGAKEKAGEKAESVSFEKEAVSFENGAVSFENGAEIKRYAKDAGEEAPSVTEGDSSPTQSAGEPLGVAAQSSEGDVQKTGDGASLEKLKEAAIMRRNPAVTKVMLTAQDEELMRRIEKATSKTEVTALDRGLGDEDAAMLLRLRELTGREIIVEEHNEDFYGYLDRASGEIHISAGNGNMMAQTFGHELTHTIEGTTGWDKLLGLVQKRTQEEGKSWGDLRKAKIAFHESHGQTLTEKDADAEIVARYVEQHLLTDEKAIRQMVRDDRSMARRVLDWLDSIWAKIAKTEGARERQFIREAREHYRNALQEAGENRKRQETYRGMVAAYEDGDDEAGDALFEEYYGTRPDALLEDPTGDLDPSEDWKIPFSFAGEGAKNANREALERAKDMENRGHDRREIRRETGWFRGADQKWRFEIDDSKMKYHRGGDAQFRRDHPEYVRYMELEEKFIEGTIKPDEVTELMELHGTWGREYLRLYERVDGGSATLRNMIEHDDLFEQYPALADVKVRFADLGQTGGYWSKKNNEIVLHEQFRGDPEAELIHEIQHAIQDVEGFAGGASPEYWEARQNTTEAIHVNDHRIEKAQKMALKAIEGLEPEVVTDFWYAANMEEQDPEGAKALQEKLEADGHADAFGDYYLAMWILQEVYAEDNPKRTAMDLYRSTAGEIEARDAASRRGMTGEERRGWHPNTGDERTVFAEKGGRQYSLKGEDGEGREYTMRDIGDLQQERYRLKEEKKRLLMANPDYAKAVEGRRYATTFKERAEASRAIRAAEAEVDTSEIDARMAEIDDLITDIRESERRRHERDQELYSGTKTAGYATLPDTRIKELDSEYESAVKAGDRKRMAELVWQAAEAAMPKSTVRGKDGKLLKVYHYTNAKFTAFDRGRARTGNEMDGFFFAPDPESSREYGNKRIVAYLNITNPAKDPYLDRLHDDSGTLLREKLAYQGYDGVIRTEADGSIYEYMAFDPEQIKSAEPVTYDDNGEVVPLSKRFDFKNPDIRFSFKGEDSEGRELTAEQQEFFKDSKVRDEQGRLMVVYHGTDGEFYEFKSEHIGENTGDRGFYGTGFYFTTSRSDASNYGNRVRSFYLNAKNPLNLDGDDWLYKLGLAEKKEIKTVDKISLETLPRGFLNVHYTTSDAPGVWRSFDRVSPAQLGEDESGRTFVQNKINAAPNVLPSDIKDLAELARERGFDACIGAGTNFGDLGTEIVVFHPNQIKSVDNTAPTDNPDIRFSFKGEENGPVEDDGVNGFTEGYYADDEAARAAHLEGYPVINGVQVVPMKTYVHNTGIMRDKAGNPVLGKDGNPRRWDNYGLVTGLGSKPGTLKVNFHNKHEYNEFYGGTIRRDGVEVALEDLTPTPGVFQRTEEDFESLVGQAPEEPGSYDYSQEELDEIEALRSRAEMEEDGTPERPTWTALEPEKLAPKLRRDYDREVRKTAEAVARSLGVPRGAKKEFLVPLAEELCREYMQRGTVSADVRDRLFEKGWREAIVQNKEFYETYKEVKDYLRTTAFTLGETDRDSLNWDDIKRRASGTVLLKNEGGLPVDTAWGELREKAPELFPEDIYNPADMLERMIEVGKSIKPQEQSLEEHYGPDAAYAKQTERMDFDAAVQQTVRELWKIRRIADDLAAEATPVTAEGEDGTVALTQEQVAAMYPALKETRRNLEKAVAKAKLSKRDREQVQRLLRHDIQPEHLDPARDNKEDILRVWEAKKAFEEAAEPIRKWNRQQKAKNLRLAEGLLDGVRLVDKKLGAAYSRETMARNFRDVVKDEKRAEKFVKTYVKPVQEASAEAIRMQNRYRDRVRALELSRKVKKGDHVSEAYAVQFYGEVSDILRVLREQEARLKKPNPRRLAARVRDGKTYAEWQEELRKLWEENPGLDRNKVENAAQEFGKIYEELFEQMNEVRVRNGYEPINHRSGYFPHFQQDGRDGLMAQFGKALGIDVEVQQLPTTINGLTHTFKPGIRWFGNALERKGFDTAYDAVEGFDRYIVGVSDVVCHTDNIQRLRALATQIRYRTGDEGLREQIRKIQERTDLSEDDKNALIRERYEQGKFELSNFVVELDEYTNLLANKKSRADRNMEQAMGRDMYNLVKALESRAAANMVAINPGSWLTNFIPITQGWAALDTRTLLKGMWDTVMAVKNDDGMVDRSAFLTGRKGTEALVQTGTQKVGNVLSTPMEWIDGFTAGALVRARYAQNRGLGLSESEAMSEADEWAAGVMADRTKGAMPTVFHRSNPITKLSTQFQLEVNNQLSYIFKDLPREKRKKGVAALAVALLKLAVGAWLINELYEKVLGRRPALDPIDMAFGFVEDWADPELDFADAAMGLGEKIAENTPFIGGLLGGGRVPISSALPDAENLLKAVGNKEWSGKKRIATAAKELAKPAVYMLPPFGGGQIKKIWEGLKMIRQGGSYTVDANGNPMLQFTLYSTDNAVQKALEAGQAMIFGKTTIRSGREWVEGGFKTLSAEQTATYQALIAMDVEQADAFNLLTALRSAETEGDKPRTAVQRDILRSSGLEGDALATVYYDLMVDDGSKEKALLESLQKSGADMGRVTNCLMDMKDADLLDGAAGSNAMRDALRASGLTDGQKQEIYHTRISDSRDDDIEAFRKAGMDMDDFLEVQNQYTTIKESYEDEGDMATAFARWVNGRSYTKEQKAVARECFKYWNMIPANADRYDKAIAAGLDDEEAYELTEDLKELGKDPKDVQKWRVGIDNAWGPENQLQQLKAVGMDDAAYAKCEALWAAGVAPAAYVRAKELESQFNEDGKGTLKNEEWTKLINSLVPSGIALPGDNERFNMTNEQMGFLWQMLTGSKSTKNNPFSAAGGEKWLAIKNADK